MMARKSRTPEWLLERQIERFRLAYQRAALDAAQHVSTKEVDFLSTNVEKLKASVKDLSFSLRRAETERDNGVNLYQDCLDRAESLHTAIEHVECLAQDFDISALPIQDFPTDILRMIIFEAAKDVPQFRWTTMAVCHDWRVLTQTTPLLWTTVTVDFAAHEDAFVDISRQALGYGGQAPLDLTLLFSRPHFPRPTPVRVNDMRVASPVFGGPPIPQPATANIAPTPAGFGTYGDFSPLPAPAPPNFEFAQDYVDIIVPHLARCRTLQWKLPSTLDLQRAPVPYPSAQEFVWEARWLSRKMRSTMMPGLETLSLDFGDSWISPAGQKEDIAIRVLTACPGLSQLSVRRAPVPSLISRRVTSLDLNMCTITLPALLDLLSQQPDLQSLRLQELHRNLSPWESNTSPNAKRPVTLTNLQFLHWDSSYRGAAHVADAFLLEHLACPNLKRAILLGRELEINLPATVAFLLRASLLEQFAICLLQPRQLESILQALMFVREFVGSSLRSPRSGRRRRTPTVSPDLVTAFSLPGVLPCLERVQLLGVEDDEDLFLPWLKARKEAAPPLKSFRIGSGPFSAIPTRFSPTPPLHVQESSSKDISDKEIEWASEVMWPFEVPF